MFLVFVDLFLIEDKYFDKIINLNRITKLLRLCSSLIVCLLPWKYVFCIFEPQHVRICQPAENLIIIYNLILNKIIIRKLYYKRELFFMGLTVIIIVS